MPNLSNKSKSIRFIWDFTELGIFNFEASLKSRQTNRKSDHSFLLFQETSTKLHLCSPCSSWCATALSTWLALYRLFWRLQIGGHGLSITIGKWKVVYMCFDLHTYFSCLSDHVIYLKLSRNFVNLACALQTLLKTRVSFWVKIVVTLWIWSALHHNNYSLLSWWYL